MKLASYVNNICNRHNWPVLFALVLLVLAVIVKPVQLNQSIYRYQIAFDISQSMQVKDVSRQGQSYDRLRLAKQAARDLLRNLPCGSYLGWSVFTGRRTLTLLTPLEVCEHYDGLLSSLDEIDGSMRWSNGSIIGKGIYQLIRAVHENEENTNIIFFSDGHEAPPLEQGQRGIQKTDKFKVSGLLIGVGGDTPVPIPKMAADGSIARNWNADEVVQKAGSTSGEELSRRHDDHLLTLSRLSGLVYHPYQSEQAFTRAAMDKRFSQKQQSAYDIRWIPALLTLMLLMWRFSPVAADFRTIMPRFSK